MFAKPINLMLVFIVTSFNLIILALPIIAMIAPYVEFGHNFGSVAIDVEIYERARVAVFFLLFISSFFMIIYLIFDFMFGFSVRASTRGCVDYNKLKDYEFLGDVFTQVQERFGRQNVKLLIKRSDEINAYALGGLRSSYIILTRGLINHYLTKSHNMDDFLLAIRSVMGHEMSHIINKDFLPTYLIITNQKITNFVSNSVYFLFAIIAKTVSNVPYGGRHTSKMIYLIYTILHFGLTLFNRIVVYNIYEFLRKFISRSIEYRCDKQSALAFGGMNMSLALSMLGKRGYFTLFSTHPATQSRINNVTQVETKDAIIKPSILNSLSNFMSFLLLLFICYYFGKEARVDIMIKSYLQSHDLIYSYVKAVWNFIKQIIGK